jgi:hypothetical protein
MIENLFVYFTSPKVLDEIMNTSVKMGKQQVDEQIKNQFIAATN